MSTKQHHHHVLYTLPGAITTLASKQELFSTYICTCVCVSVNWFGLHTKLTTAPFVCREQTSMKTECLLSCREILNVAVSPASRRLNQMFGFSKSSQCPKGLQNDPMI